MFGCLFIAGGGMSCEKQHLGAILVLLNEDVTYFRGRQKFKVKVVATRHLGDEL